MFHLIHYITARNSKMMYGRWNPTGKDIFGNLDSFFSKAHKFVKILRLNKIKNLIAEKKPYFEIVEEPFFFTYSAAYCTPLK